jgi:hypothetical protein
MSHPASHRFAASVSGREQRIIGLAVSGRLADRFRAKWSNGRLEAIIWLVATVANIQIASHAGTLSLVAREFCYSRCSRQSLADTLSGVSLSRAATTTPTPTSRCWVSLLDSAVSSSLLSEADTLSRAAATTPTPTPRIPSCCHWPFASTTLVLTRYWNYHFNIR